MKPEEDAFGQGLWAHYNGKESFEIVERDDGYIDAMSPMAYFSEHKDWPPLVQKAMEFAKGRVIDVGCGAGRHSLCLQEKGLDVLGIDISPLATKVCKLRGLRKAEVMSIDKVNFKPNSFDTIIMMGNNFGLFHSFKEARELLKRFHKMTSPNALIVAESRSLGDPNLLWHAVGSLQILDRESSRGRGLGNHRVQGPRKRLEGKGRPTSRRIERRRKKRPRKGLPTTSEGSYPQGALLVQRLRQHRI